MKELVELVPFSNSVYITELNDYTYCIPEIINLMKTTPSSVISNMGGWQSPSYNYDSHEFIKSLCDEVREYVLSIYNSMHVTGNAELCNYWINVNTKYNYNISHRHGGSYYSAVVYLKTPKNCGRLIFQRPDDAHSWIEYSEYVDGNWGSYWVDPLPNRLIIFPSYIPHYVEQNLTEDLDDSRISVAFNFR